ncbi:MAG TPA: WXG100 family type VII secretion target [Micromonosporaceae bacterium]|nr:WXG100 family type VII secretion target [Micromonosporaceae bacterium]
MSTSNDGLLVVNFAALEQASRDIQSAINELTGQLGNLEADAKPLVATWGGTAREAYDANHLKWTNAANDLTRMLRDIKTAVDESAAEYQATEIRNANMFR